MEYGITTEFAPAERLAVATVLSQVKSLSDKGAIPSLIESMPVMVMVLNAQRQCVHANKALVGFIGVADPMEVLAKRPGEILTCQRSLEGEFGCGSTEQCGFCGASIAILEGRKGRNCIRECSIMRGGDHTGEALNLRVWVNPFKLGGEGFTLVSILDIAAEKRRQMLERIFFHDVLNAAGALKGFVELLEGATAEETDSLRNAIRELTLQVIDEIEAQRSLVEAENFELHVHMQPMNSGVFLSDLSRNQTGSLWCEEKKVVLSERMEPADFVSDPRILSRVMGNAIKNALEATPAGGCIELNSWLEGDDILFSVHNDAVIPHEVRMHLFMRNYSTKGSGRGFGTYSIKLLTERYLEGSVLLESEEGIGTTLTLRYKHRV